MIIYYSGMRYKDKNKNEAIFQATIQLLNEIGFSEISMSKIAKRAQVSPGTIYVYFENKEDMLRKLFLNVEQKISSSMFQGLHHPLPVKARFELVMSNFIEFTINHKDEFLFFEQFCNSPLIDNVYPVDSNSMFEPLYKLIEEGKEQKLLKDYDTMLLLVLIYAPVTELAKQYFREEFEFNDKNVKDLIQASWDAIRA
ncbi:TetR/AcrR family transcriptional regulator [Paenibacillus oralis]|uniref:TetR/AcrR family transcriptional regulator n=1 Tax=Paenibacillus oralis TaxID=2490856 RepID=A0A3P3U4H5_9BACL|nr:TetR/AcrR family transcriptional regulator [Paenibacillus oralis]RRJ65145.1 TetR/AcrR family transcriptional regulator [Paenibacillus oralis]